MQDELSIFVAFLGGTFSFLSPCVLPLFPLYLSFITGMSVEELSDARAKTLKPVAIELVNSIACSSCDVTVLDMKDRAVADRANSLGIRSLPAIVIEGKLAACCSGQGINEAALRGEGIGQPTP